MVCGRGGADAVAASMPWYAAHAIVYFQHTGGTRGQFHVYENVFLVGAGNPGEACDKVREFAHREEGDDRGSLGVGGRPA